MADVLGGGAMDQAAAGAVPRPLIFISYRHQDLRSKILTLGRELTVRFGPDAVFLDRDRLEGGTRWPTEIRTALDRATVLLVAIGERWFSTADRYHRRRIDDEDDWVRLEVLTALRAGKPVIPVRFDDIPALQPAALPEPLRALADIQSVELRDSDWEPDLARLLTRLEHYGLRQPTADVAYPTPTVKPPPAAEAEIEEFLLRQPAWAISYREDPKVPGRQRRGIGTTLRFLSFTDAMDFMAAATPGIVDRNHHPEWTNVWASVTVWITQFDIGGEITHRSLELADHLMAVYAPYGEALSAL